MKQSSMDDDQITEAAAAAEASEIAQKASVAKKNLAAEEIDAEDAEEEASSKKRFEFFSRFRRHSKDESADTVNLPPDTHEAPDRNATPSSSSFSTHFATVPRAASKIKESIISKWNKRPSFKMHSRSNSDSLPRRFSQGSSADQPIRLAAKISLDDEEETLGILQTKERIEMAKYDQENRAIHEISKARESEFKSRKPILTHQDSDLLSDESNRDIGWEECELMRNSLLNQTQPPVLSKEEERRLRSRLRHDSNFSTEETQSSGSSGDRRRTGVIEDIDDDEFFLRQRGVSQDNVQISQFLSSAIREDLASSPRNTLAYSDENFNHDVDRYSDRGRNFDLETFSKSFESEYDNNNDHIDDFKYDDYLTRNRHIHGADDISDRDVPVSSRYFPRDDDDNILFYQNEYMEGIEQPTIHVSNEFYGDSISANSATDYKSTPPAVPKRKKRESKNKKNKEPPNTDEEVR